VTTQGARVPGRRLPRKVVAVVGSPRKGHSYELVERIGQLLCRDGDVQVEIVLLGKLNLQPCRGCYVCQSRGEQYCPLKDDLAPLVARMKEADGVLLVSPTYTGNVSALMKNLMDRMAWAAHRPPFIGKAAMLVTTASMGTRDALRALSWFAFTGFDVVAKVGWPVWPSPRRDWFRGEADEKKLQKAVDRFKRAMERPSRALSLRHVIEFYVMKTTPVSDPAFFAADEQYHRDIDALGFEVAWWKRMLGELSYRIAMGWIDHRLGAKAKRGGVWPARPVLDDEAVAAEGDLADDDAPQSP